MKIRANHCKKIDYIYQKNHTCRWYDDTQSFKISYSNSTSFVRYKNNKFLTNHLDSFLAWKLLFLYLTNKVEFGQDILQSCVSSYHLHVWFFGEFRRLFCRGLHGFSRRLRFPPDMFPSTNSIAFGLVLFFQPLFSRKSKIKFLAWKQETWPSVVMLA